MKALNVAAALVVGSGSLLLPLSAQTGVMTASRGTPAAARPSAPTPSPQGRPSPTAPPRLTLPPFGWSMNTRLRPLPGRGAFPVRLPAFGILFVDSYWWASDGFDPAYAPFPQGPPPVDPNRPTGGLQLDVDPRQALVYANGWPMGVVESFSGYYQHLDLPAGPHLIEIVAPGYETLVVELTVTPGRTTTYRGTLNRARD
jgi:hypothetical protein